MPDTPSKSSSITLASKPDETKPPMNRIPPLEVLFTPNEFDALTPQRLESTVCVVFDVLRATTSMITALAHGASAIRPVSTIQEALEARFRDPSVLPGGERHGLRITTDQTTFDLGNSPAEYTQPIVRHRTLVVTTTNGTRALHAARPALATYVASFLNLDATVQALREQQPSHLLIIGAGTYEEAALEDTLAAGALVDALQDLFPASEWADSALLAHLLYRQLGHDLPQALALSRNGRRLLQHPQLHPDVAFASQRNAFPIVAQLNSDGFITSRPLSSPA